MVRRDLITRISIVLFIQPVPWFRGREHINLQPCCSPPHSASCLLLKAEAHSFFCSVLSSLLLFLLVVLLVVAHSTESPRLILQQQEPQQPATNRKILPLCSMDADIINIFWNNNNIWIVFLMDADYQHACYRLWRTRKVTAEWLHRFIQGLSCTEHKNWTNVQWTQLVIEHNRPHSGAAIGQVSGANADG